MKRDEFLSGLAEALPSELYCTALKIRFQVNDTDAFGEAVKAASVVGKQLGEQWNCEPSISVEPAFLAIEIGFTV